VAHQNVSKHLLVAGWPAFFTACAEYFLIGTLTSVSAGLIAGLLVAQLLPFL